MGERSPDREIGGHPTPGFSGTARDLGKRRFYVTKY